MARPTAAGDPDRDSRTGAAEAASVLDPPVPDLDFTALFDATPGPCLVLSSQLKIISVNAVYLALVRRERDDLVGRDLFAAFPPGPDDPGGAYTRSLALSLERVLREGRSDTMAIQRYDIPVGAAPDLRWEERYWRTTNVPVPGPTGAVRYVLHRPEDVTQFARMQSDAHGHTSTIALQALEIQTSHERLRAATRQAIGMARIAQAARRRLDAVLETVPVGVFVTDLKGRLVSTNPANQALWGPWQPSLGSLIDYDRWKGRWVDDPRHGQSLATDEWPMARALRGETVVQETIEVDSFDQPPVRRTLHVCAAPILDAQGQVNGCVTVVTDVSDRLRFDQALREVDRHQDEFLAMLAHELRNPLAPFSAAAQLLAQGNLSPERLAHASAIIARQTRHLTAMVDDLLDVSRVTSGLIKLDDAEFDAQRFIQEAVEQVQPLVEARGHHLAVHLPAQPVRVRGDIKRLVQVMTNLLDNAAKYTPQGGHIEVELAHEDGHALLSVMDDGIGMSRELLEHVFDLFSQAERTADRSQGGLGIGLALVRRLVELHGGQVTAFSPGVGRGSRFVVSLPALEQPARVTPEDGSQAAAVPAKQRLRVMVVDDNEDAAQTLAMLVETLGYEVSVENHALDALDALEQGRADPPDVFLLDIGLPQMDGYELARRLRADPATAGALLVAISGYGHEQDKRRAREAGFDHHFVKPANIERLLELLAQAAHTPVHAQAAQ